jgi:hypothetical protein
VLLLVVAIAAFLVTRQRAVAVPILAVIAAPYALVHELMLWLAPLWLVVGCQRRDRAALPWLVAAIWLVADLGVAEPLWGGDAAAAVLGLIALWLVRGYQATPRAISEMK